MATTELQPTVSRSTPNKATSADPLKRVSLERSHDLMVELRAMVRDKLEAAEEADPRVAIEVVLRECVAGSRYDLIVQAAREGLKEFAVDFIHRDATRRTDQHYGAASGKWDDAAEATAKHRDVFEARVYTGAETKFLGDCTKADLIAAAEVKQKQGVTLLDNAARLVKLSQKLKRDQTVSSLDRAVVEGVFSA